MIVDASFLIDLDRGADAALAALHTLTEDRTPMRIPAPAASEFLAGVEDPIANLHDLETSFSLLDLDRDHVLETALVAARSIAEGRFPGWTDAQIGAAARLFGEEILTGNPAHFEALGCEVWDYRNEARHPEGES